MTLEAGDVAPPVDLPTHDGRRWTLASQRGCPVLLVFHRHLA